MPAEAEIKWKHRFLWLFAIACLAFFAFLIFLWQLGKAVSAAAVSLAVNTVYWHQNNSNLETWNAGIQAAADSAAIWPASAVGASMVLNNPTPSDNSAGI